MLFIRRPLKNEKDYFKNRKNEWRSAKMSDEIQKAEVRWPIKRRQQHLDKTKFQPRL